MMYQITFYVPEDALETVKASLFNAGAGKVGNYEACAWQVKGEGQFRPLQGSDPYSGQLNQLYKCEEWMVQMVCEKAVLERVIVSLKEAHPYETPAYTVVKLEEL